MYLAVIYMISVVIQRKGKLFSCGLIQALEIENPKDREICNMHDCHFNPS